MNTEVNEVTINGVKYLKEGCCKNEKVEDFDGMKYAIVRTYSAGVFAGYIEKKEGMEVTLRNARRIWYWDGAASISQLGMDGTSKPENCKFPKEVDRVLLTQVIEILDVTKKAKNSIDGVKPWEQ
jgi:hypothetical protein